MVYLQHTERNDHPYCLATIIASDLLLTVATCFERDPAIQDISGYIRKPLDPYRHRQFFAISGELEFIVNFPGTFRDFPWYLQSIHPSQLYRHFIACHQSCFWLHVTHDAISASQRGMEILPMLNWTILMDR